ncbi:regulatory protein RecX [Psychroserpens sp.]|uniref:regulatory protein RecX n=1 Tax=Psychroserpens sp. TaxID=2020870 RepID=UPI001B0245AD|nr:regulatory protein RecX [Psychroserpens sp.]MBO6605539.1 RecX family transcriptional regulator [Psychroserpens sp.]MBO6630790.1 RecX family transcriptional regulator [Psychroserpens sp.]MBO6653652.1 RecX family transcriptional regulator [Psychroserpens sp.]MBO6681973.1 RecX family transcriptional regulator [Psychroserpens sp.]MBO6748913.1 RecX family transcriptional regulator [Psychroserpens sp.]
MYPRKTYTFDEAKRRLERYCAYQERCHQEVRRKLIEMRMIPEAQDKIIVHLLEHNYLNEERFVEAFIRGKFRIKKWGKQRLQMELKRKDIHPTLIRKALNRLNTDEYWETFDQLAVQKLESIKESNLQKKRKKLADFLLYRGWESPMVYDKVRELIP